MKDIEVIEIDNKEYAILKDATRNNTTYLFLSNTQDPKDIMIRKSEKDSDLYVPLDNDNEYTVASLLLFKK